MYLYFENFLGLENVAAIVFINVSFSLPLHQSKAMRDQINGFEIWVQNFCFVDLQRSVMFYITGNIGDSGLSELSLLLFNVLILLMILKVYLLAHSFIRYFNVSNLATFDDLCQHKWLQNSLLETYNLIEFLGIMLLYIYMISATILGIV